MENKAYFKKSVFGGFNREDVIAYLAEQARAQTQERAALAKAAEKSAADVRRLQEENERLAQSAAEAAEKLSELSTRLNAAETVRTATEERLAKLQADLAVAAGELCAGDSVKLETAQVDELLRRMEALSAKNAELAANVSRLTRFKESVQGLLDGGEPHV